MLSDQYQILLCQTWSSAGWREVAGVNSLIQRLDGSLDELQKHCDDTAVMQSNITAEYVR